jgi:hypothetical protein
MVFGLILSVGLTPSTCCQAAKLSTYLTAKDLAGRELLDQDGKPLSLATLDHPRRAIADGSTPTYVAFPLHGGEHLPAGITTLVAGSQAGAATVGPLDLDSTITANLNAALAASATGMAVVDTPKQDYLVEYLPHYGRMLWESATGKPSQTWLATAAPGVAQTTTTATQTTKASSSGAGNELARLLDDGQNTMANLSATGVADIEKLLDIKNSKPTATKPSLNLEAQVLESPVPEPSTWLIFGLILGAAGLRQRLPRRAGTNRPDSL